MDLSFCEEYSYPDEVRRQLADLANVPGGCAGESMILVGGTSRGELSYERVDDELRIYSDYECLIVADGRTSRRRARELRSHFEGVRERIDGGTPFFHIDYNYLSNRSFRRMDRTFFTFDAKSTGIAIRGPDIVNELPEVTSDTIDLRESNETLIWRLWQMLLYQPLSIVSDRTTSEVWERYFGYALCKNSLDLTTWLFPWEGRLVSSFGTRVRELREGYARMDASDYFGEQFPEFLTRCLEGKLHLDLAGFELVSHYRQAIAYFRDVIRYVFGKLEIETGGDESQDIVISNGNRIFREDRPKRKVYDAYLALSKGGLRRCLRWYQCNKRALTFTVLLRFHEAVLAHIDESTEAAATALEEVRGNLERLTEKSIPVHDSFIKNYETIRRRLTEFMKRYYIWIRNEGSHVDEVTARALER